MLYLLFFYLHAFLCSEENSIYDQLESFAIESGEKDKKKLHIVIYGTEAPCLLDKWLSLKGKIFGSRLKKEKRKISKNHYSASYSGDYWHYTLEQGEYGKELYGNLYDFHWGYFLELEEKKIFINGPMASFARKEAGKALYLIICDYCRENKIAMSELELCIFGFSHGGNVAAEFINEVKRQKNNEISIEQLIFFETPKTEKTEKSIHLKNLHGEYIVKHVLDVNAKKHIDVVQMADYTSCFPCCARHFLFSRPHLYELVLTEPFSYSHAEFLDLGFAQGVKIFLDKYLCESNLVKNDREIYTLEYPFKEGNTHDILFSFEEKTFNSRNPFRWLLYYRKSSFFIFLFCVLFEKYNRFDIFLQIIKKLKEADIK